MPFTTPNPPFLAAKTTPSGMAFPAILPDDVAQLKALIYAQHAAAEIAMKSAVETAVQSAVAQLHADTAGEIQAIKKEAQDTVNTAKREAQAYIQHMLEQLVLARHRMFGVSSEQLSAQGRLFDEVELFASTSTEADDTAALTSLVPAEGTNTTKKTGRGKRRPLPTELPRVDVIHDVPEADRTCACGTPMVEIGQDSSEQLDIIPMQLRVLSHIRKRYGCVSSLHAPVTAALPPQPLPKSNASPDFLAMLIAVKYVDGMPLTRFTKVLARHDVQVPEQTLARWVIGCKNVVQPLFNLMRDSLFDHDVIFMDETVVQVLKVPDKNPTSNSYMWVQVGGAPGKTVVIYDFDPSRSAAVPVRLLHDYRGYLMTDGYKGYNRLATTPGIEHMACWAHTRRYFVDAVKVHPKKGKRGRADDAVTLIGKLYRIERDHKDASNADRLQARQQHSLPVLAELHSWMVKTAPVVNPESVLGKALAYLDHYWHLLTRYTERGDLPIDNNAAENKIRPFVVGRKAWLFSTSVAGANASAVMYSLMQTAIANGVEPYTWLRRVMRELPAATTVEQVEALLPWNCRLTDEIDAIS